MFGVGGAIRVMLVDADGKELAASDALTSQPEKWKWNYEINTELTDSKVGWTDDWDFSAMDGKEIRLRFELKNAKLYSFTFTAETKVER